MILLLSLSSAIVSDVPCFGNTRGKKIQLDNGSLTVAIDPPYAPAKYSVIDFVVDEGSRGRGTGTKLVSELLKLYPNNIGAQCSSAASVAIFYKFGFRQPRDPDGTLNSALESMKEDSSVYLKKM